MSSLYVLFAAMPWAAICQDCDLVGECDVSGQSVNFLQTGMIHKEQVLTPPPKRVGGWQLFQTKAAWGDKFAAVTDKDGPVYVIQVGANDEKIGATNDPLTAALGKPNVHALLVEPNPPVFKILQHNLQTQWGAPARLKALQTAVCGETSGDISFFVVDDKFAQDFPQCPHWARYELSAMTRHQITKHWIDLQDFVHSEEEFAEYVKELKVECLTPSDLISREKWAADKIDLLEVDAEGADASIVHAFLGLNGFAPQLIIFEAKHLDHEALTGLLEALVAHGYEYDFDQKQFNVYAFKAHP